jgi:hypothetical protein
MSWRASAVHKLTLFTPAISHPQIVRRPDIPAPILKDQSPRTPPASSLALSVLDCRRRASASSRNPTDHRNISKARLHPLANHDVPVTTMLTILTIPRDYQQLSKVPAPIPTASPHRQFPNTLEQHFPSSRSVFTSLQKSPVHSSKMYLYISTWPIATIAD